jgi:hypothetical protein
VDQYVDNRQKEILWDILANPADNGALYAQSLERLVHENPQSGILQVLYARAGDKQLLNKAAVYYDPRTLYKLVNHPADLAAVDSAGINYSSAGVTEPSTYSNTNTTTDTVIVAEETEAQAIDTVQDEAIITEETIAEPIAEIAEETATEIETTDSYSPPVIEQEEAVTEAVTEEPVSQQEPEAEQQPVAETQATEQQQPVADVPEQTATEEPYQRNSRFPKREVPNNIELPAPESPVQQQQDIEDDVYDEIVSIDDIGFEAITHEDAAAPLTEARFSDPTVETGPEEEEASAVLFHQPEGVAEPATDHTKTIEQEDRLILGGIVNTDYLSFDKKLDELRNNTAPAEATKTSAPQPETAPAPETQEVSRYDDDKMPYTFMWWLNKTRKEHAENLRPYATTGIATKTGDTARRPKAADELQHQYYENIFSLTPVSGVDRDTDPAGIAFDPNKKEDIIIERFIHTEPQIKPQSADKLDNENKAKKSSEDQADFVTETLARIYTDQMLYHKAIATYKKLILKYPEKKLYFAAQIEQLEKKTN